MSSGLSAHRPGIGCGFELCLGGIQAASRESHGERMRRYGVLLVRELPGQDLRGPGEIWLTSCPPEPGHPEEHPAVTLQPVDDAVLEEEPEGP